MAKKEKPTPRFAVGDWTYNPLCNKNYRVLRVAWEDGYGLFRSTWRYSVAGYSTLDPMGPREDVSNVEHELIPGSANVWRPVKEGA